MEINIRHHNVDLKDYQIAYIREKIEHLSKYSERVADESVQANVDVEANKVKTSNENISFQITLVVPRAIIRAEVHAVTIEEATDEACEKLKKQIERYKSKQHRRNAKGHWIPSSTLETISNAQDSAYEEVVKITKRKKFSAGEPMHEEEAIERLELLGHKFFIFRNIDTNFYNVIYKRDDDSYGLIELTEC